MAGALPSKPKSDSIRPNVDSVRPEQLGDMPSLPLQRATCVAHLLGQEGLVGCTSAKLQISLYGQGQAAAIPNRALSFLVRRMDQVEIRIQDKGKIQKFFEVLIVQLVAGLDEERQNSSHLF